MLFISGKKYEKYNINMDWKDFKPFLHSEINSEDKSAGKFKLWVSLLKKQTVQKYCCCCCC